MIIYANGNTCLASNIRCNVLILILLLAVEIPNSLMICLMVQRLGGVLDVIHLIRLRRMNVALFCNDKKQKMFGDMIIYMLPCITLMIGAVVELGE